MATAINHQHPNFRIDFIGIGAAKPATTWIADCLREHPEIYLPSKKELNYFNQHIYDNKKIKNWKYDQPLSWYHQYFKDAQFSQVKGEFCPTYLKNENAAADIFKYNPRVKILVVLRNPIDRAYSYYLFQKQKGNQPVESFEEAIKQTPSILEESLYFQQLAPYFKLFPASQIKVMLYEDIAQKGQVLFSELFSFLGVKGDFEVEARPKSNVTQGVRWAALNRFISNGRQWLNRHDLRTLRKILKYSGVIFVAESIPDRFNKQPLKQSTKLSPSTRQSLYAYFASDIAKLEKLLDVNLDVWRAV